MNSAIIVAAGSGKRFGGKTAKQFLEIKNKPLIIYTLEVFQACPKIDEIVLVFPASEVSGFLSIISKYQITKLSKIVSGGKTRAESVFKGFQAVKTKKSGIVAVHDGARPLVSVAEISETIETAEKNGAACLAVRVTDTIKEVSETGKILRTIPRETLFRALTPQCFRYEILKKALSLSDLNESATDESYLVEKLGVEISIVEGSSRNIKVTVPEDLLFVKNVLKENV